MDKAFVFGIPVEGEYFIGRDEESKRLSNNFRSSKKDERKHCKIVVYIDEFQQIGEFANSLSIQKKMRLVWQHQKDVSYCIYGSKLHMMTSLFQKKVSFRGV